MKVRAEFNYSFIQCSFYDEENNFLFLANVIMPPRIGEKVRYQDHTQPSIEDIVWVVTSVEHVFREGCAEISHYTVTLGKPN